VFLAPFMKALGMASLLIMDGRKFSSDFVNFFECLKVSFNA